MAKQWGSFLSAAAGLWGHVCILELELVLQRHSGKLEGGSSGEDTMATHRDHMAAFWDGVGNHS